MGSRLLALLAIIAIFVALGFWANDAAQLFYFTEGYAGSQTYTLLFTSYYLMIPLAMFLGIFLGAMNHKKKKELVLDGKVERHDELMFIQHWTNALGIVVLLVTGFALGTMFIPRFISGTETVGFFLNLHFVGVLFFFFGASFFVSQGFVTGDIGHMMPKKGDLMDFINHYKAMLTKAEAPEEEKFLAAERMVFPMWILGVAGISISGIIKVSAHIWMLPVGLMKLATLMHGVFAIYMGFMLVAHVFAAAVIPPSWPLFVSMITGNVKEDYVKSHHQKWYREILENQEKDA